MQYWGKIHQGRPLRQGNRWRLSPRPRGGNQTFGSRLSLVCPFLLCAAGLEAGVRELGISRKSSIELNGVGKVLKSGCSRRNDCSDAVAVVGCIGRSVTVAVIGTVIFFFPTQVKENLLMHIFFSLFKITFIGV
ncbi:hypothetical protein CsSME_00004963 [Camellia sinensis var. sinensis]